MIGVPLFAADTDEQAHYLATTAYQRILALFRGQSMQMKPPVASMNGLWQPHEQRAVEEFLAMAVIGGPAQVKADLERILQQTEADELIFTCDFYHFADRKRSFEIAAALKH